MKVEYTKLASLSSSIVTIDRTTGVHYGDIVSLHFQDQSLIGQVIGLKEDSAQVQVFGDTSGMTLTNASVVFEGKPFTLALNREILGRVFDGAGRPIDGGGEIYSDRSYNINGSAMNPVSRQYPSDFIQTGISSIDGLMTIIRGQKLPIFSGAGLDHDRIAAQIIRQSEIRHTQDDFVFVFGAIGVQKDEADFFTQTFRSAGVQDKVVTFMNLANDPVMERILVPKCALTAADYLAFEEGMHVLVILSDLTSYAETLRELSSLREEVPSRKGYPGYLYSDLAAIYERAGILRDRRGSITLLPILTMPNDDITHPIPDLTGYITEGQIVLSRSMNQKGIYPPIDVLPSLSRLMKDSIGADFTREDHATLSAQLYSAYARVEDVRNLAQVIGEEDLSEEDRQVLAFGDAFEQQFLRQDFDEKRTIEQTLDLGWRLLALLPESLLSQVSPEMKEKYLPKRASTEA